MTENTVLQLGNPLLRQIATPVTVFNSPEFLDCLSSMQTLMESGNGVGIAAPQIGVAMQIVIVASRPTNRYPDAPEMPATILCNPQLEILDPTLIKGWEGCLSVPGIRALVPRYQAIRVRFQDREGKSQQIDLKDFPARVFQHEFDHLQGLVYLDRIESSRDIVAESEYLKLIAH
ncbi:MAG: peptide deformylase [Methylococcaceae bacterium]|jgi:peptide deformylase|nr:peptide deformylase [Methylococcaceae bacterium]